MPQTRKPKYRFLDSAALPEVVAEPVPLEGVFQLTRPRFEPLTSDDVPRLDDGEKPTAVGKAAMEWWGKVNEEDWEKCPTGLVRGIEAISANIENAERIRQAIKGTSARWERNHAGVFSAVTLDVLVPAVGLATVQPRENTAYGRLLRERHQEPLIHEIGDNLEIRGSSANHFDHIRSVQLEVIEPSQYRGDSSDFVDSLALEGIREPLRGFAYRLSATNRQNGYQVETNDGYTRVAVAQHIISSLLGGVVADLSRLPWENQDGTLTIRDWSADKIVELHEAIEFSEAPFAVWPEVESTAGISRWLEAASPAAEAVMRLMIARMVVGIKIKPYARNFTHDVVYADMARFHVKSHQPRPWGRSDEEAVKGRTIVSSLTREGFIDQAERDVFLGLNEVPWKDDPKRSPYRNRLVATTDTIVRMVVDDPHDADRYRTVRQTLKSMQVPISPAQAAAAAASLAAEVAGLAGSGEIGGFTAMLRRSFSNPAIRRLSGQEGDWTVQIVAELDQIVATAREELESVLGTRAHATYLGPNMRALAILGMVAHGMNPKLADYRRQDGSDREGNRRTTPWPASMTMTGRGGRGGTSTADAHQIVFNMARSPLGLSQLEAIVRAVIDHDEPMVPTDRETGDELLEDYVRRLWGEKPAANGEPRPSNGEASTDEAIGGGSGDLGSRLSEIGAWGETVARLREELRGLASNATSLSRLPAGPDELEMDPEEWDPEDDSLPRMIDKRGIDDEVANGYDDDIEMVRKFFSGGLLVWLRGRRRS